MYQISSYPHKMRATKLQNADIWDMLVALPFDDFLLLTISFINVCLLLSPQLDHPINTPAGSVTCPPSRRRTLEPSRLTVHFPYGCNSEPSSAHCETNCPEELICQPAKLNYLTISFFFLNGFCCFRKEYLPNSVSGPKSGPINISCGFNVSAKV